MHNINQISCMFMHHWMSHSVRNNYACIYVSDEDPLFWSAFYQVFIPLIILPVKEPLVDSNDEFKWINKNYNEHAQWEGNCNKYNDCRTLCSSRFLKISVCFSAANHSLDTDSRIVLEIQIISTSPLLNITNWIRSDVCQWGHLVTSLPAG